MRIGYARVSTDDQEYRCVYGEDVEAGLRFLFNAMAPKQIDGFLGEAADGMRHYFEQFATGMEWCWTDLGSPQLGPELQKKIVDGVLEEADGRSIEALSQERDTLILGLLELLSHRGKAERVAVRRETGDDS